MTGRTDSVFMAKLAEQAERYEGKWLIFDATSGHFVLLESWVVLSL